MKITDIIIGSLTSGGDISEKRVTRMVVVIICMILTICDFFIYSHGWRYEIFLAWLGFAGYDGFRITQEKKSQAAELTKSDQAKEVTKQVEAIAEQK
jgi:hypothetical protein